MNGRETNLQPRRDGRRGHGTDAPQAARGDPAEVRAVGLSPKRRDWLAISLRTVRSVRRGGFYGNAEDYADKCAQLRREAIISEYADRTDAERHDGEIMVRACARYLRQTEEEFVRGALHDHISSLIECAISEKDTDEDLRGLLTRQERAAMITPLRDWCDHLKRNGSERR